MLAAMTALGCAGQRAARYPMWEPIAKDVPTVASRAEGRRWLRQSRAIWHFMRDKPPEFRPYQPSPKGRRRAV
jgi:hypothetical protein